MSRLTPYRFCLIASMVIATCVQSPSTMAQVLSPIDSLIIPVDTVFEAPGDNYFRVSTTSDGTMAYFGTLPFYPLTRKLAFACRIDLNQFRLIDTFHVRSASVSRIAPDGSTLWFGSGLQSGQQYWVLNANTRALIDSGLVYRKAGKSKDMGGWIMDIFHEPSGRNVYFGITYFEQYGSDYYSRSGLVCKASPDMQRAEYLNVSGSPMFGLTRSGKYVNIYAVDSSDTHGKRRSASKGYINDGYSSDTTVDQLASPAQWHDDIQDIAICPIAPGIRIASTNQALHNAYGRPLKRWQHISTSDGIRDIWTGELVAKVPIIHCVNADTSVGYHFAANWVPNQVKSFIVKAYALPPVDTGRIAIDIDTAGMITFPMRFLNRSYGDSRVLVSTDWIFDDTVAKGRLIYRTFHTPGLKSLRIIMTWHDSSKTIVDTSFTVEPPSPYYRWHSYAGATNARNLQYESGDVDLRVLRPRSTVNIVLDSISREPSSVREVHWTIGDAYQNVWSNATGHSVWARLRLSGSPARIVVAEYQLRHGEYVVLTDSANIRCHTGGAIFTANDNMRDILTLHVFVRDTCYGNSYGAAHTYTIDKLSNESVTAWNPPNTWQFATNGVDVSEAVSADYRVQYHGGYFRVTDRSGAVLKSDVFYETDRLDRSIEYWPVITGDHVIMRRGSLGILEGRMYYSPLQNLHPMQSIEQSPFVVGEYGDRVVVGDTRVDSIVRTLFRTPFRVIDLAVAPDRRHIAMLDDRGYVFEYEVDSLRDYTTSVNDRPDRDVHAGEALDARLIPNPTTGSVRLEGVPHMAHVRIIDHWGTVLSADQQTVDTSTWPAGSYLVIVDVGTQRRVIPLRVVR